MALYVLIAVQFVPETPRFLLAKGRHEEAFAFLVEYHGNGDREDPLVLYEFEEMKEAIRLEQEVKAEKWSNIIKTPGSLRRIGLAVLMTFLTGLSGCELATNMGSTLLFLGSDCRYVCLTSHDHLLLLLLSESKKSIINFPLQSHVS